MEAEGTIWGKVTAPLEIAFAQVRIDVSTPLGTFPDSNTGIMNFRAAVEVSADGTFRHEGLPLGEYRLLATHPLFPPYRTRFELHTGSGTGPLEVALGSLGSLVVRVVDASGRGLKGDSFVLHRVGSFHHEYRLEPASRQVAGAPTDSNGEVRFANLQPEVYVLTRRGAVTEQRQVTVMADRETVVVFSAGASLVGVLRGRDRELIPGTKLHLTGDGGRVYETRTDDSGAFAIGSIEGGDYRITVFASQLGVDAIRLPEAIEVENGRAHEVELCLPTIRLCGGVFHAEENDAPVTSKKVLVSVQAISDGGDYFSRSTWTTGEGRFEIAGLYPGRYAISAEPRPLDEEHEEYARVSVTVTPTPAVQELVIRLRKVARTGRVCLRVLGPDGNPASDLFFSIDGRCLTRSLDGVLRCVDATVVQPGVYEIRTTPGTHSINIRTRPKRTEAGGDSFCWEEISVDVADGQTVAKDVALEKLHGGGPGSAPR